VFLELAHDIASTEPSAERKAVAREGVRRLYEALNRLDAKQRIAFCLHVIDGMPVARVAASMDATVVATKVRIFRARRALELRAAKDPVLKDFMEAT
jgi:DNA-directed RNA polymerase specialized sigma24 family protein